MPPRAARVYHGRICDPPARGRPLAFRDFTFPEVFAALGLTYGEADLLAGVAPMEVRPHFAQMLREGAALALRIATEKARSEFMIAPVLLEARSVLGPIFGLFSGTELDADASRGLNGFCDFILTRSAMQLAVTAPLMAIVEAKNDNLRSGLGQCVAAVVASQVVNKRAGDERAVWGCVTTGSAWKFFRLDKAHVSFDIPEYLIGDPGQLLGILRHILGPG